MCKVSIRQDRGRGSHQGVNNAANLPPGPNKGQQDDEHSPGVQSLARVSRARRPALVQAGSCDLWLAVAVHSTSEGQNPLPRAQASQMSL